MKLKHFFVFSCVFVFFILSGCATSRPTIDHDALLQFKEGVSTEAEVLAKLGRPTSTTTTGTSKTITYYGYNFKVRPETFIPFVGAFVGGSDYSMNAFIFEFGKDGVIKSISHSNTNGSTSLLSSGNKQ